MGKLIDLIPAYREINGIYSKLVADVCPLRFEWQKTLTDFWKEYSDTQEIEAEIIQLVIEMDAENRALLLGSLKTEAEKNKILYEKNRAVFDALDVQAVCFSHADSLNREIAVQMEDAKEYSARLTEAEHQIERIWTANVNALQTKKLEDELQSCKDEYAKSKSKLQELYAKKAELMQEALSNIEKRFDDINILSKELLDVLGKYNTASTSAIPESGTYFDMGFLSKVHEECNGEEFEDISQLDFYTSINLLPSHTLLKVKVNAKTRVCYLIFLLSERLPQERREEWKGKILNHLGISIKVYQSKYKEPVSSDPSRINRDFARRMDEIFK